MTVEFARSLQRGLRVERHGLRHASLRVHPAVGHAAHGIAAGQTSHGRSEVFVNLLAVIPGLVNWDYSGIIWYNMGYNGDYSGISAVEWNNPLVNV